MNRQIEILSTPDFSLRRFDHPPEFVHSDPRQEVATQYAVSFVERGSFEIAAGRQMWCFEAGDLLLSHPGMRHRFRHAETCPTDVCLSLTFKASVPQELAAAWPGQLRPLLPASNRLRYLHRGLVRRSASRDSMHLETLAGELLSELTTTRAARHTYQTDQFHWYAERVDAAREMLDKHSDTEHSLAALARTVGMSTFLFARVFSELAGTPPHQYLLGVRLRRAAWMLRQGARVTDTCFACGFNNLSHFVRSFRRRFGVPPATYAKQLLS